MLKGKQVWKRRRFADAEEYVRLAQVWPSVAKSYKYHEFVFDDDSQSVTTNISWRDLGFVFQIANVTLMQKTRAWEVEPAEDNNGEEVET